MGPWVPLRMRPSSRPEHSHASVGYATPPSRGITYARFLRRLPLPHSVKHWSLTTLREKLIKIGPKVVSGVRYIIIQMAEVAIPRRLFRAILERTGRLRLPEAVPR